MNTFTLCTICMHTSGSVLSTGVVEKCSLTVKAASLASPASLSTMQAHLMQVVKVQYYSINENKYLMWVCIVAIIIPFKLIDSSIGWAQVENMVYHYTQSMLWLRSIDTIAMTGILFTAQWINVRLIHFIIISIVLKNYEH